MNVDVHSPKGICMFLYTSQAPQFSREGRRFKNDSMLCYFLIDHVCFFGKLADNWPQMYHLSGNKMAFVIVIKLFLFFFNVHLTAHILKYASCNLFTPIH